MREVLPGARPLEELAGPEAAGPGPAARDAPRRGTAGEREPLALRDTRPALAYPRAIVGDWADSASISMHPDGGEALYARTLARWDDPRVVPIVAGYVPFQAGGVEELGGGFARLLPSARPAAVHVVNPSGLDRDEPSGRPLFTMGRGRTKIVVFSPAAARRNSGLTLRPYPGRPGTRLVAFLAAEDYSHRGVRLAAEGTPVADGSAGRGDGAAHSARASPPASSTVVLVVDEGRGVLDARTPVTVVGLASRPAGASRRRRRGGRRLGRVPDPEGRLLRHDASRWSTCARSTCASRRPSTRRSPASWPAPSSSAGEDCRLFEQEFAAYCGARHAVGVANGTDALALALRAYGVGPGDEVVTVANTFIATGEAILLNGARPVFVDVDEASFTMDPAGSRRRSRRARR